MNFADSYYRVWRKITIEFGGTFTEFGGDFLPSLAVIFYRVWRRSGMSFFRHAPSPTGWVPSEKGSS